MSIPSELWKKWEGRVIDEKFPLRQWLGGSDHSAVFLTERMGGQKAAIKLIAVENLGEEVQLSRWAAAAKFSHPHVIRLFDGGRCTVDDTKLLYVVMEYAEENLGQILPLRPLSPGEASEMLEPATEALASLHRSAIAHGSIRPSNILAVDNQLKLSADTLAKVGERGVPRPPSVYDPPEMAYKGPSPAGDIWSLGASLVAVLTQNEPKMNGAAREAVKVPNTMAQPFREIARECLRDQQQRCTAEDILRRLHPLPAAEPSTAKEIIVHPEEEHSKRWIVVAIVAAALMLGVWLGFRVLFHQSQASPAETPGMAQPAAGDAPPTQAPAPFSGKQQSANKGSVLRQVLPEVSRNAQSTITGHVKVSVQVAVDGLGNVSDAKLVSPGPSKYFASRSLAAARQWKFHAPQAAGQAVPSEWLLRFQIGSTSIEVFSSQIKP
jgi:serine/threonine protein kinase